MKTLKLLFLLISISIFGQHQIRLKSGEKIDGLVKSLSNGVLTVAIKENSLTFKQSDISSIYFEKENLPSVTPNMKGNIKGVVTYYFNQNYGDKPDVGAKIYVRKTDSISKKNSVINKFQRVKVCRYLLQMKTNIEDCKKTLANLGVETDADFDKLNSTILSEFLGMDFNKNIKKITADGNGNYSLSLDPGLYEIIFVSKGRNDLSVAEIEGKISNEFINLKPGDELTVDKRFDK